MKYALLILAFAACTPATAQPDKTGDGKAAFKTVHEAFLHPRCRNCHPAGDAPLFGNDGRPHAQNISRKSVKNGLGCATCHTEKNGKRLGQPPGAPHWVLPPPDVMIFEGRTPRQLCEQLKDPKQTGGRDVAKLIEHVDKDALVQWGWDPGPGREPLTVPKARLIEAMKTWAAAGAPCPD